MSTGYGVAIQCRGLSRFVSGELHCMHDRGRRKQAHPLLRLLPLHAALGALLCSPLAHHAALATCRLGLCRALRPGHLGQLRRCE